MYDKQYFIAEYSSPQITALLRISFLIVLVQCQGQRQEILNYAQTESVLKASRQYHVTSSTIYEWRRKQERRKTKDFQKEIENEMVKEAAVDCQLRRDEKIMSMWRQHPGFGPSQIRNNLKRNGYKVSVGTVRHVMEEGGYLPPKLKIKEPARISCLSLKY